MRLSSHLQDPVFLSLFPKERKPVVAKIRLGGPHRWGREISFVAAGSRTTIHRLSSL
jgi:hypothetical protein